MQTKAQTIQATVFYPPPSTRFCETEENNNDDANHNQQKTSTNNNRHTEMSGAFDFVWPGLRSAGLHWVGPAPAGVL